MAPRKMENGNFDRQTMADVLIVEDQALVSAGMRALLQKAAPHYRVHEESSSQGAIARLAAGSFQFVFIDIHLGSGASGLDVLRFVREREMPCHVIMLSGDDDLATVRACISQGASGYITKAAGDGSVFSAAIGAVLDNRVYLPASILERAPRNDAAAGAYGRSAASLGLTPRQCEVLYYLCQGLPNKAIANRMGISEGTVRKGYVSELLRFFGVARRTELLIEVSRRGIRIAAAGSEGP